MNQRIEIVVMARLSLGGRPPTAAQLAKQALRYKPATMEDSAWHVAIEAAMQRVGERRDLADQLGAHKATKWEHWTDKLLPAAALGIRLDDARALKRLSVANGWATAVAARALGLWKDGPPPSLGALGDAVVWHDLGIAGAPEPCPPRLRAHLLRRHIDVEGAKADGLVRQIAARAVKAPNVTPKELRDAIVRAWLAAAPATPSRSLIDDALAAARAATDGVFGERKVFISTVWDALRRTPAWAQLALDDFKTQLVAAHRDRKLELARADYTPAMDPALVAASEIAVGSAAFHFIVRER
jgi:hypothetical protein